MTPSRASASRVCPHPFRAGGAERLLASAHASYKAIRRSPGEARMRHDLVVDGLRLRERDDVAQRLVAALSVDMTDDGYGPARRHQAWEGSHAASCPPISRGRRPCDELTCASVGEAGDISPHRRLLVPGERCRLIRLTTRAG